MTGIQGPLGTLIDFLLVAFGFGLIVFIHELGHFVAARWAGIRVLAFSVGFGQVLLSYRKGLGWRRGSSDDEYKARAKEGLAAGLGVTEYRLSSLPLGGYVRMLGQDDLDPTDVSDAADSYQRCVVWKRMVVISAGVAANIATAALLFILVFTVGLKVDPPRVGGVIDASAAARAVAENAEALGVNTPGLQAGDLVTEVNGRRATRFDDLVIAAAMSRRQEPVGLVVERPGVAEPLRFSVTPTKGEATGLLEMGILPAAGVAVVTPAPGEDAERFPGIMRAMGLAGVEPGMRLVSAGGEPVVTASTLDEVFDAARGEPVTLAFAAKDAGPGDAPSLQLTLPGRPMRQVTLAALPDGVRMPSSHVLGLTGVIRVGSLGRAPPEPLLEGDVLIRVGSVDYPSPAQARREIIAHAGRAISLRVQRGGETLSLTAKVKADGTIGFQLDDTFFTSALLALPDEAAPAEEPVGDDAAAEPAPPAAARVLDRPGLTLVAVNGAGVQTLADAWRVLREVTRPAAEAAAGAEVTLDLRTPAEPAVDIRRVWSLTADEVRALHDLGWQSPAPPDLFEPASALLRAEQPLGGIALGLGETRRVILNVYVTIHRLFHGTVGVQHLTGPVGIARYGTIIASRGPVWLVFFLALVSVNLAVVNFLPLPIVDGGQFLMLLYEQLRGKPVPLPVQNAVTLAGLVLVGSMFLIVTFNDVRGLLGL